MGKRLVDDRDVACPGIVVPSEIPSSHQARSSRRKVAGRDGEILRAECASGHPKISRTHAENERTASSGAERGLIDDSDGANTGDAGHFLEHALLHLRGGSIGMSAHVQIGLGQEHALRLEAERRVQRALHAAQGNKGCRDQQSAERNLHAQEKLAKREAAKNNRAGAAALHHLRGVRRPDLPHRDQAPQHPASDRQQQGYEVDLWIGADGHMNRKFRKWLPARQGVQQESGENGSEGAAKNREEDRLRKQLPEDIPSARSDCQPDGEFAAAVRSACRKEAGEVGTGGKEHEQRQQHNSRQKRASGGSKLVAHQTRFCQSRVQAIVGTILPRQFLRDGVEIIGGLLRSDARLQPSENQKIVREATREIIRGIAARAVDDRHPEGRPKKHLGSVKSWRRDSDHRERMFVHIDRSPNDAGIRIEMCPPKVIAQNDIGSGVRPMFVARMKEPALRRLHAQHVEEIAGNSVVPAFVSRVLCAEACTLDPVSRHVAEGRILALKIQVVGVGLIVVPLLLGHVEGPQKRRIQHAEHNDVGTDPKN